jgi:hypothetical protein
MRARGFLAAQPFRATGRRGQARHMLLALGMFARIRPNERWTVPLEILMWTLLSCGLIAVMVVVMLNG